MKRERWIDVLKGISILFVVFTHSEWTAEERLKFGFPFWIAMAVPLFMLVSGYVFAKSYERKGISTIRDAYAVDSIVEKLIRYTIPFAISYTIQVVLMDAFGVMEWPGIKIYLEFFQYGGYGLGSYYYPIMLQFVFLFPAVFLITKLFFRRFSKHASWVLVIWFVADLVYELWASALPIDSGVYRLEIYRYLFLIAFGCYVGMGGKMNKLFGFLLAVCGAVFIYLISYRDLQFGFVDGWASTSLLPALFILPFFYYFSRSSAACRPLELVGKASYNIFLVQMAWFQFEKLIIPVFPSRFVRLGLNLLVCTVVGIGFYYVETPITKWCIKKFRCLVKLIEGGDITEEKLSS